MNAISETNWKFENKELSLEDIPEDAIGFIYLITNLKTDRKYIGRKLLTKAAKKTVTLKNGKKKKETCRKESDWKNYYSSCKELNEDIEIIGKEYFKRELLYFCSSVSTLNYMEAKYQFLNEVLESDEFYNANIMIRTYKRNIKDKL